MMHLPPSDIEINPNVSVVTGPFSDHDKKTYALHIQGHDTAVEINNIQSIPQSRDGAFSVGYWIRFDNIREQFISGHRIDTAQGTHFRSVVMNKEGRLQHLAHRTTSDSKWRIVSSPDALLPGRWYFILISRGVTGDNTKRMYVNGKYAADNTVDNELETLDSFDSFQLGGDIGNYSGFEGDIAEIMLFPKALNDKEVQTLYESVVDHL
jgi:hypothetical protein